MDVKYDTILGALREGDSGGGGGGGGVDSNTVKKLISSAIANSVGSGAIEIFQGGTSKGSFNVNQSGGTSITLDAGGGADVIYSGATVTSMVAGSNVQMSINGGVLSVSATDTQPTPVMASGSAITSVTAGANVTLGVAGGVMTISATDTGIDSATASSIASSVAGGMIPTVGSAAITISQGAVSSSFSVNATEAVTITLPDPGIGSATASSIASSVAAGMIPTVGSATITITQGGVSKGFFSVNATQNSTIELDAGGGGGDSYTERRDAALIFG